MVFGTPLTWLIVEILAFGLFVMCVIHASKHEHGIIKVLELIGFIVYAGIYENIGVYMHIYNYNLHRNMLIGKVPLEILMLEAVIFYVAFQLAEHLHIPRWGLPFVVGFLSSIQDITVDPSAVFDRYLLDVTLSGQWNWTPRYEGAFFGIPFFNFSGWMWMMVYYAFAIQIGAWLYKKYKKDLIGYLYPFVGALLAVLLLVSPITTFFLFAAPFFPFYTKGAEIVLLVVNFSIGLFILLRTAKIDRPFDLKKDGILFYIPLGLHLFDIVIAFALQIEIAYVPVIVVSLIHIAYLAYLFAKGKRARPLAST